MSEGFVSKLNRARLFALYHCERGGHLPEIDPANFNEMQLISVRPEQEERFLGYLFFSQDLAERERFLENVPSTDLLVYEG